MNNTAADDSKFPLNRIIAFLGPYISVASGALASWLLVHVHFLGLFHFKQDGLSAGIAQGAIFLLTTLVTWAGHSKWLTGHQILLQNGAEAAAAAADGPGAGLPSEIPPTGDELNFEPADALRAQAAADAPPDSGEPLPTDDEEFASSPDAVPPDPESRVTPDPPEAL